jgi:hypothetical protein
MKVRCLYDKLVPIEELKAHPQNRNKHSDSQIQRLARIIEYQGWRYPLKVSRLSGCITAGHGRLLAAKANGWSQVPVNYQDYDSEEQEYADVQADNAIASWAELDLSAINTDIGDLGPDFDIDMLGLRGFVLEPMELLPLPPPQKETQGGDSGLATKIILYFEEGQYFKVMEAAQKLIASHGYTDLSEMFSDLVLGAVR